MANASGTIDSIAIELGKLLEPLLDDLNPGRSKVFFAELGVNLSSAQITAISGPLDTSISAVSNLIDITSDLIQAIEVEDVAQIAFKGIEAITQVGNVITGFSNISSAVQGQGIPGSIANKLPERIFHYLLAHYLDRTPGVNSVFELMGVLEREDFNLGSIDENNPPYTINTYKFDQLVNWFSNPSTQLETLYDWGTPQFDGTKLFILLEKVFARLNFPVLYIDSPSPKLDVVFLEVVPKTDVNPKGILIKLKDKISSGQQSIKMGDFKVDMDVEFDPPQDTGILLQPNGDVTFQPPNNLALNGGFDLKLSIKNDNNPYVLFGQAGGNRLELEEIIFSLGTNVSWSGSEATGDFDFSGALKGLKLFIDGSNADGFISTLLGDTKVEADFDLLMGVSSQRGFYFGGSSALEVRVPTHIELGPVTIEGITITLGIKDGTIPTSVGVDLKAELGPMVVVINNIGVKSDFSFPSNNSGNLGPVQMDLGFKPPNGLGLSIDTGMIKGGGFLYFDTEKGEYFGALELSIEGTISLKAIGIINTKMPDGSPGFAFLILITAEFTPIQLGYGFTLLGVGGLLALNRSVDLDALRSGVRTGAVSNILFPQDIIANINRIISDLKTIFPIVEDHFIIAPMGKIGWGTPTLISLEVGIVLDIPKPAFVILGILRCILPTEEAPILNLQVNFAGGIDFNAGLIWFDASLFDSSLLVFTLTGDMALRIGWNEPIFVLSVGGFHPAFKEIPSDLTGMKRLTLSLLSGSNPRLTAEIYFAITSNTIQSGAKVELYAGAGGFNLYGFLGYDLLIQFSPFYFIAQIYAGLALRSGTSVLAGVSVHCELSGPTPWNANGEARLKILFFTIKVGFNETWGQDAPAQPIESEDILKLVKSALEDDRNWNANIPSSTNHSVTLKEIELPEDKIIIHPFGVLSTSQKVVPLGLEIEKFGNKKPLSDSYFEIEYNDPSEKLQEEFAVGNFIDLDDKDKLARKSFERMESGLKFSTGDSVVSGNTLQKEVNYELSYIHKKKAFKVGLLKLFSGIFNILLPGTEISKNAFSVTKKIAYNSPAEVAVTKPGYSIANVDNLEPSIPGFLANTETEAYGKLNQILKEDPSLKGKVQVVSNFEL